MRKNVVMEVTIISILYILNLDQRNMLWKVEIYPANYKSLVININSIFR